MDATVNGVRDGRVRGIHRRAHGSYRVLHSTHVHVDLRRNFHVLDRPQQGKLQPQGAREISGSKRKKLFRLLKANINLTFNSMV